ncbi:hypothetical protein EJ070_08145 [Mesorhizobium sp. M1E.F.Ca.ET.045.02.1.1]|nr:hypothetical protein EJ070_08145 [Mesorhizobium sp. M1E.F.Ca.ET.045.02.1.1]
MGETGSLGNREGRFGGPSLHLRRKCLKRWREAPPLACRPSPPQGVRSDVALAFANRQRCKRAPRTKLPISPLAGEMPGRAEGGAVPPTLGSLSAWRWGFSPTTAPH